MLKYPDNRTVGRLSALVVLRRPQSGPSVEETGFGIDRVQPGNYDIKAEKAGFQILEAKGLTLMIGQDMGYDLVFDNRIRPDGLHKFIFADQSACVLNEYAEGVEKLAP